MFQHVSNAVLTGILTLAIPLFDCQLDFAGVPGDDEFTSSVVPILKSYCIGCHGGSEPKADLSLVDLEIDFDERIETWKTVLERVADGTMPPETEPQPTVDERRLVSAWLGERLVSHSNRQAAMYGRARLRRAKIISFAPGERAASRA